MRIGTLIGYELDNTYDFHGVVEPMIFNFPTGEMHQDWGIHSADVFSEFLGEAPHFSSEKSSFSLIMIIQPGSLL